MPATEVADRGEVLVEGLGINERDDTSPHQFPSLLVLAVESL